jgi:hypothetical protein
VEIIGADMSFYIPVEARQLGLAAPFRLFLCNAVDRLFFFYIHGRGGGGVSCVFVSAAPSPPSPTQKGIN